MTQSQLAENDSHSRQTSDHQSIEVVNDDNIRM